MYNGIGLMTPRGSGTSGYVMKNLSHMKKVQNRDDFIKELKNMKDNVIEARKKANPEILLHEQLRDIEVKKLELREALEAKGVSEKEIQEKVNKLEKRLQDQLEQGKLTINSVQDTHALNKLKEDQQKRIDRAFGIKEGEYKPGSAFDFEGQEKERLEKQYKRELRKAEELIRRKELKREEKRKQKMIEKQLQFQQQKQLTDGLYVEEKLKKKIKKDK